MSLTIFISYSRSDTTIVEQLRKRLASAGVALWIDHERLTPGTPDWEAAIREGIHTSDVVVYLASPGARESPFVRSELLVAERFGRRIVPLWIAGVHWIDATPFSLGSIQYIDARGDRFDAGVTQLFETLGVREPAVAVFPPVKQVISADVQGVSSPAPLVPPARPPTNTHATKPASPRAKPASVYLKRRIALVTAGGACVLLLVAVLIITTRPQTQTLTQTQAQDTVNAVNTTSAASHATYVAAEVNTAYAAVPLTVYSAPIPGTCGSDPASWFNGGFDPSSVVVACSPQGAVVTTSSNQFNGTTFFGPALGHDLAFSFTVAVDVTQLQSHSCAGIDVYTSQGEAAFDTYDFLVCDGGSWEVNKSGGTLLSGTVAGSTYHLKITVGRNSQSFSINGSPTQMVTDSSYAGANSIALGVEPRGNAPSAGTTSATFSHYVYTPLPFTPGT